MLELLLGLVVGVVIGWHIPQPAWARAAEEKVVEEVKVVEEKVVAKTRGKKSS